MKMDTMLNENVKINNFQVKIRTGRVPTIALPQAEDFLHILPKRETSLVKEYYYEEIENLSLSEREMWLGQQCTLFEQEVRKFFNDKENFIEEFHKKLRKVTRRWASWNHRNFGPVTSREQVRELLVWARQNQPKYGHSTDVEDIDRLEEFESYCKKSTRLLQTFRQDIYRPLCDFFSGDDADLIIKEIKLLEKCVQRWEALLQFSPINEKLFSRHSEKVVTNATRFLTTETDCVLRLIPDLHEKQIEALRLARKWRVIVKSKDIQRRGTYVLSPKTLDKRENMSRPRVLAVRQENLENNRARSYDEINEELRNTQLKYRETTMELDKTKNKCNSCENEIRSRTRECGKLKEELKQINENRKAIEFKVNESQISHNSSIYALTESSESFRDKLWHKELESVKIKYSTQKIKLMNARKQIESLNKQLESSQQKYEHLGTKVDTTSAKCNKLEEQLEVARKNIQTQGNMVDALQHQCYTLKQDLDQSNVKKGELYNELNATLERCKTVETDLLRARGRCNELEQEAGRRGSREEILERENAQLRHILETQTKRRRSREETLERENIHLKTLLNQKPTPKSPNKKDCIFPDINAGRSF